MLLLNGEAIPQLFITIVRYVLPYEDHTIQKLLLLYLEIVEKTDACGRVMPEMILVCQHLRDNLQHPNEYIRGVTLRFLCRLNETEIIEPLIHSVLSNLEHRHPFVRRNAILAVMTIYKLPQGDQLLADAPETIAKAFYPQNKIHLPREMRFRIGVVVLEVCRTNRGEQRKYIKIIISPLNVPSTAVIYECTGTLVSLSSAPTAIRAAANTYCQLLLSQSDNNVKLIVLDRLNELKTSHRLLRPGELEKNGEYRQMLVQAIHSCAIKFPEVTSTVVHLLMDLWGDRNVASATDVIHAARVCSCALWIIGEYCLLLSEVERGIATIKQCLGDPPFYTAIEEGDSTEASKASQPVNAITVSSRRPAIPADGTYATQSAASETALHLPSCPRILGFYWKSKIVDSDW
ncbi:Clathrin/coatomer adaptor, adaptin-like, N-terminal [Dillenia turbinata]|uniref:Clathrin/coatomer adaptor, adaptin-like, N-terminal n=1 Tax=Dillenia turbinata TaxID=194707 RepID=A0AAN8UG28_9MAGN